MNEYPVLERSRVTACKTFELFAISRDSALVLAFNKMMRLYPGLLEINRLDCEAVKGTYSRTTRTRKFQIAIWFTSEV